MIYRDTAALQWWESRRWRYNIGLIAAGVLAFIAYAVLGSWLFADDDFELTIFTLGFQSIGYLFMMVVANVCYLLGPWSEQYVKPDDPPRYRANCFRLGSCSLYFCLSRCRCLSLSAPSRIAWPKVPSPFYESSTGKLF